MTLTIKKNEWDQGSACYVSRVKTETFLLKAFNGLCHMVQTEKGFHAGFSKWRSLDPLLIEIRRKVSLTNSGSKWIIGGQKHNFGVQGKPVEPVRYLPSSTFDRGTETC